MAGDFRVFLVGDSLDKAHVRFDHGKHLVVSPRGTQKTGGFPDGRQENSITLTPAEARRMAYLLLAELEPVDVAAKHGEPAD